MNRLLEAIGVIDRPLPLLYNDFAIVVGLVYVYIPLMILPIYAALERLGTAPRDAAQDLYATPIQTLRSVTIPLSLPGIVAGCILVFVPSLGNFLIPDLLGGGKTIMLGNLIQQQFLQARDWPFGAVLATVVISLMVVVLAGQSRVLRRERVATGGG